MLELDQYQERDLQMMLDPGQWPNVVLPMKNRGRAGVLASNLRGTAFAWMPDQNMYGEIDISKATLIDRAGMVQLLLDGWMVD